MKRLYYAAAVLAVVLGGPAYARADYLIWTDNRNFGPGGDIQRANTDGSGRQTLVTGLDGPTSIAFNPDDGKMYWSEFDSNTETGDVRRANVNGSGQQIIVPT